MSAPLVIETLPALTDNLMYVLRDEATGLTCVIDPSEATPVIHFLKSKNWKLDFIINTHHHWDHVGGNLELKNLFSCKVLCSAFDKPRIPGADFGYVDSDNIPFGNAPLQVIAVPGHTVGAIALYNKSNAALFTGDTLFPLGCGRLYEGTPEQMRNSLERLAQLPDDTRVFSGHDYLYANACFNLTINHSDDTIDALQKKLKSNPNSSRESLPTTVGFEKKHNSFMNTKSISEFAQIREQKNQFRLEE